MRRRFWIYFIAAYLLLGCRHTYALFGQNAARQEAEQSRNFWEAVAFIAIALIPVALVVGAGLGSAARKKAESDRKFENIKKSIIEEQRQGSKALNTSTERRKLT